ncbi:hypothetical protein Goklo_028992 [Gossypium klotzschianum]|uniref:DUF7745 domain-containing protein n=1 Tax=Gossypium klotzschianum TaxID=34286 RepID=A0A7J8W8W7_9ROSI|nr:hypothetical protein [Gossypium klotzschianum]
MWPSELGLKKFSKKMGDSLIEGYVLELWDFTPINNSLFQALTQYWNPAYSCFTFGKVDLVPTIEEHTTLLRCLRIQADKAYARASYVLTFLKKLMNITRMSEQWVAAQIKQKGDSKCIPWKNL